MINKNTYQIESIIVVAQRYLEDNHYRDSYWQNKIAEECRKLTEGNDLKIYYVPKVIRDIKLANDVKVRIKKGVTIIAVLVVIDDPLDMKNEELKNKWGEEITKSIDYLKEKFPHVLIQHGINVKAKLDTGEE